jgi:phage-related minor tail protein
LTHTQRGSQRLLSSEGGDSLIDWSAWEPPITAAINIISTLGDMITNTFGYIMDIARAVSSLLVGDFSGAWDSLGSAGQRIVTQFGFVADIFNQVIEVIKWLAELLVGDLSAAWEAMGAVVDRVVGGIMRAIDAVRDAANAVSNFAGGVGDSAAETASSAWQGTKSFFGFGGDEAAPPSAPSPQAAATLGGMNQTVSQNTEIIVQGASDPQATARAVSGQQNRVNADLTRNLAGAAR